MILQRAGTGLITNAPSVPIRSTSAGAAVVARDLDAPSSNAAPSLPVLVVDQVGHVAAAVADAIADTEIVVCGDPRELADLLSTRQFATVVAGPGLDDQAGFERLRIIREELPLVPVVLAADVSLVSIRDVVRAGAVDLVAPDDGYPALQDAARRAITIAANAKPAAPSSSGLALSTRTQATLPPRVFTIASASGGCGKTFVATNLAWHLQQTGGRRVCIIDLDLQFGEVSPALRLKPRYTITDLLAHAADGGDIEAHFPEFCMEHSSGVHVLAAPLEPTESGLVGPSAVGRLIDAAKLHFDDIIIDTPPALGDNVVVAYHRSDELLVLATLDVPSIRNLKVFLATLERLDVPDDGIHLFLNKAETRAGVDVRQILTLFPRGFDATLPYAREVPRSINSGHPVLKHFPDAKISRQLADALKRLLPEDRQTDLPARGGSRFDWLRRVRGAGS